MKYYKNQWGFSYKEIMTMPREKFSEYHGIRFLNMEYCEFRRVIKRETPYMDRAYVECVLWRSDRRVNKFEHKACQLGVWDEINVVI